MAPKPAPVRLHRLAGTGAAMPADCPPSVGPCPPSPLGLGLGVDTPRCDDHAWCLLRSSGSLGSLQTAASAPSIPAPATDSLRAAIRKLDASLPLADVLQLGPGEGYLVLRRPHTPAPSLAPAAAAPAAGPAAAPAAPRTWTVADEQRYQHSLAQLARLVQLRASLWPCLQAWHRRQAALRALALQPPQSSGALQHLLRWAVMQRLRQLQQLQHQWKQAPAAPQPQPKQQAKQAPPQPQEPELEASSVLLQLSRDSSCSQTSQSQDPSTSSPNMPPPPPRPPRPQPPPQQPQPQQQQPPPQHAGAATCALQPTAQHGICLVAAPAAPLVRLQLAGQQLQLHCAQRTSHVRPSEVAPPAKRQRLAALHQQ